MAGAGEAASMVQGGGVPGAAATQVAPPPQHAPEEFNGGTAQSAMHHGSFDQETLTREQRFEAALSCREEGKGVKPRQGCASVQLNRECKEGTRTPEFVKFLEVVRHTADSEVLGSFGANPGSFDRADYMKVDRPLQCAQPRAAAVMLVRVPFEAVLTCPAVVGVANVRSCWPRDGQVLQ